MTDIPGWAYVVAFVIGLFFLVLAIWFIGKASHQQIEVLGKI